MALTLRYHAKARFPSRSREWSRTGSASRSLAEIERLPIYIGNRKVALAELFAVSGDPVRRANRSGG